MKACSFCNYENSDDVYICQKCKRIIDPTHPYYGELQNKNGGFSTDQNEMFEVLFCISSKPEEATSRLTDPGFNQGFMQISPGMVAISGSKAASLSGVGVGTALGGIVGGLLGNTVGKALHKSKIFRINPDKSKAFFDAKTKVASIFLNNGKWLCIRLKLQMFNREYKKDLQYFEETLQRVFGSQFEYKCLQRRSAFAIVYIIIAVFVVALAIWLFATQ